MTFTRAMKWNVRRCTDVDMNIRDLSTKFIFQWASAARGKCYRNSCCHSGTNGDQALNWNRWRCHWQHRVFWMVNSDRYRKFNTNRRDGSLGIARRWTNVGLKVKISWILLNLCTISTNPTQQCNNESTCTSAITWLWQIERGSFYSFRIGSQSKPYVHI